MSAIQKFHYYYDVEVTAIFWPNSLQAEYYSDKIYTPRVVMSKRNFVYNLFTSSGLRDGAIGSFFHGVILKTAK